MPIKEIVIAKRVQRKALARSYLWKIDRNGSYITRTRAYTGSWSVYMIVLILLPIRGLVVANCACKRKALARSYLYTICRG